MSASAPQINITLGTAGHIDHGKTALIKCLTGCETDRLKEEKERGMSIELGFAPCTVAGVEVGIVDVPGHEHFVKTMVAGASGMDGVILVVAADDGVMPQTREHLDILTLLGVQHGIVALTKIDRVDADLLEMARADVRAFLQGTFLADAPIVGISNVTGEGFDGFIEALIALVRGMRPRLVDGVFRLPVERAFSVKGYGTVLSGIPVSGSARAGDELVLLPAGLAGRIKAIQVYGRDSDTVLAGQCAALNMRHWDHDVIERGNVVAVPGCFEAAEWCVCRVRMLEQERPALKSGTQVKFHTGTSEVLATVYLLRDGNLLAGQDDFVQVRLARPVVAGPGDRFIIRSLTPVQTIGGGTVIEPTSRRLKRNRPGVIEDLAERSRALTNASTFVEYCIRGAEGLAATREEVCHRVKMLPAMLEPIVRTLASEGRVFNLGDDLLMHRQTADAASQRLLERIGEFHRQSPESPGIPFDELSQTAGLQKTVLEGLLKVLEHQGKVAEKGRRFSLAGHRGSFSEKDRLLLEAVESLFAEQLFRPPEVEQVAEKLQLTAAEAARAIRMLREHDRLVWVAEGLMFHRNAVERAREILLVYFRDESRLESVRFKYLLDTTRKYAIPLLDHMDRIGVTTRVGNTRYLKEARNAGARPPSSEG